MIHLATKDKTKRQEVWDRLQQRVLSLTNSKFSLDVARQIQKMVAENTGTKDPFLSYKRRYNNQALQIYSDLKQWIEISGDPFLLSLRLAIAGNIIDFVAKPKFDLKQTVQESLQCDLSEFDYSTLLRALKTADKILYLGDNAGEIVFDKLVIEHFKRTGKKITLAVRSGPILNDATMEDVHFIGLNKIVDVITTGSNLPGVVLKECSSQFNSRFKEADLIISKGQGNFEGLCDEVAPIFFFLKAKCAPIAKELDTHVGAVVLKANPHFNWMSPKEGGAKKIGGIG
jgi:hypothetical protein